MKYSEIEASKLLNAGELPMTFKKNAGQVIGLITADVGSEVRKYVFTDDGYESLEDIFLLLED